VLPKCYQGETLRQFKTEILPDDLERAKDGKVLVLLWIHHATAHGGNNLSALQFSFFGGKIARLKGIFPSDKGNEWSIVANYLYSK